MHLYLHQDINWNNCALKAMRLQTSITIIFFPLVCPHSTCSVDSSSSANLLNVDGPQFFTPNPLFFLIFIIFLGSFILSQVFFISLPHIHLLRYEPIFFTYPTKVIAHMPMPRSAPPVSLASVMGSALHQLCSCLSKKRAHQAEFFPPSLCTSIQSPDAVNCTF